jgi:hypothetical protein
MRKTPPDGLGWRIWLPALAIGLVSAALHVTWALRTMDGLVWTGPFFDFIVATYLSVLMLEFQRRYGLGVVLTAIFCLGALAAGIAKHVLLAEGPAFADLFLLGDLWSFYADQPAILPLLLAALAALHVVLTLWNLKRPWGPAWLLPLPILAFVLLAVAKTAAPGVAARLVPATAPYYSWYPEAMAFGFWGSFGRSALLYADRRHTAMELASRVAPNPGFLAREIDQPQRRNIYVVIVESLMDPASLKGASYSADPFTGIFRDWRRQQGARAVQPVLGGRSPDGEFEVLCGLPAILDGIQVVVDRLTVTAPDCLPRKLAALGWRSMAWVPVQPQVFRSGINYPRLGFEHLHLSDRLEMTDLDGGTLSEDSLLAQNLAALAADGVPDAKAPVFNYVFGTANHFPYGLNAEKRPATITVTPDDPVLAAYVNSVFYVTAAIDRYVVELRRRDPDGIVVILGDHAPPLPLTAPGLTYPRDIAERFDVPLIIIDGPRGALPLHGHIPAYLVPEIVADLLTEGRFCGALACLKNQPLRFRPLLGQMLIYRDRDSAEETTDCGRFPDNADCIAAKLAADAFKLQLYRMTDSVD